MKTITIRGIDAKLSENLKTAALRESKSINQYLLELLRKNLGLEKEKKFTKKYHDLDHLFGKWDENEFKQIESGLKAQRKIDKELWK